MMTAMKPDAFEDENERIPMNDLDLARELVGRLNRLCEDPEVREVLGRLIESRVAAPSLQDDSTIQASGRGDVGFLGVLNGLVGIIPDGPKKGRGFVAAVRDTGTHELLRFELTASPESKTP